MSDPVPLSAEQVADIRHAALDGEFSDEGTVLALCDTVDALRAENERLTALTSDGTQVSVDISTGDDDAYDRLFPRITGWHQTDDGPMLLTELGCGCDGQEVADGCLVHEPPARLEHKLAAAESELETLRGIAKRMRDGWYPDRRFERWQSGAFVVEQEEPMSEAEIQAIYGKEQSHE